MIGTDIDYLYELKQQKAVINKQLKELNEKIAVAEKAVLTSLSEAGISMAKGNSCSAVISTDIVPNVTDWDSVYKYILENDATYLLQRRINAAAWRELHEQDETIPGTEPFTKTTIATRKI